MAPLMNGLCLNRTRQFIRCPHIVKIRESADLDNTPGIVYDSGYAVKAKPVHQFSNMIHFKTNCPEGGIVQNVPNEARVLLMGAFIFLKAGTRVADYLAENIGRSNNLGIQSQNNCMRMRCSQHGIPSSKQFVESVFINKRELYALTQKENSS